jgi:5'-3' exonuclease
MSYILIDSANMFARARHVVRADDIETKIGMAFHIMFASVNKCFKDLGGTHVVFCFEGRSWRKDFYTPYKAQRKVALQAKSQADQDEDAAFWGAFDEFREFVETKSNCTTLQHPRCEADDFIARWAQNHPNDKHVIVSSDSDFYQMISENITQYNGITKEWITLDGVVNDAGKPVIDKKTKEQKQIGDPEWLLFEKCMRGDTSDNIFSAFPGVRKKGTKNKVGLLEAFADKDSKGFDWNNMMLQRWTDHEGVEHRVLDDYNRNKHIIDLTLQPDDIKQALDEKIVEQVTKKRIGQVGLHFMKMCGKWDLQRLSASATEHSVYLNKAYGDE